MTGGRGLGPGSMRRDERGRYVLDYRDADRRQRRVVLSEDKRTAERMRAEIINERDLQDSGLGSQEGMDRTLGELRDAFLEELKATRAAFWAAERPIGHGTKGPGWAARSRPRRIPQAALWQTFVTVGLRAGEAIGATGRTTTT